MYDILYIYMLSSRSHSTRTNNYFINFPSLCTYTYVGVRVILDLLVANVYSFFFFLLFGVKRFRISLSRTAQTYERIIKYWIRSTYILEIYIDERISFVLNVIEKKKKNLE